MQYNEVELFYIHWWTIGAIFVLEILSLVYWEVYKLRKSGMNIFLANIVRSLLLPMMKPSANKTGCLYTVR